MSNTSTQTPAGPTGESQAVGGNINPSDNKFTNWLSHVLSDLGKNGIFIALIAVVVLFSTIFTFSDFNIVYILTHGGPINSTHLFATLSRMLGIEVGRLGEGAAVSLYLFPLLVFVVWAQLRFVRKQTY